MRNPRQQAADLIRQLTPEVILDVAALCDGHSILMPQAFLKAGLPEAAVTYLTRTYRSDGSPKGTIFVNGQPVKQLEGVYGLDCLHFLADALDVAYRGAMGRGFEAANIRSALAQHLARPSDGQDSAAPGE